MPPKKKDTGRPTRPQNDFLLFCEWMRSANVGVHEYNGGPLVPLKTLSAAKQQKWFAECWDGTLRFPEGGITIAGHKFNDLPQMKAYFRANYNALQEQWDKDVAAWKEQNKAKPSSQSSQNSASTGTTKGKGAGRPKKPENDFLLFCRWMRSDEAVGVQDPDTGKPVPLKDLHFTQQNKWFAACWGGTLAFPEGGITIAGLKFMTLPDMKTYFKVKYNALKEQWDKDTAAWEEQNKAKLSSLPSDDESDGEEDVPLSTRPAAKVQAGGKGKPNSASTGTPSPRPNPS